MEINIGLKESQRKPVIDILHALLADEVPLYIKTGNYHWNVEGPDFLDAAPARWLDSKRGSSNRVRN